MHANTPPRSQRRYPRAAAGGARKSATTAASGVAKVKVKATKAGKLVVTVTKAGYANASATIKVAR